MSLCGKCGKVTPVGCRICIKCISGIESNFIDRDEWPVPDKIKGASARDAFLWYICQAWPKFFGGNDEIKTMIDHDFGLHIFERGNWQLELRNLKEFPKE